MDVNKGFENTMRAAGCDIDKIIEFRRDVHQHAELGFKEFETSKKIKDLLLSFGVPESCIIPCAGTGLIVELQGTADSVSTGLKCVALRADMDALPIPEKNSDLPYHTVTNAAHMCGHDGHMAMLLAAAAAIAKNRDKIPKDQKVRLLFQPAEEASESGAMAMIKGGCLESVEEIYGLHNVPNFPAGMVFVCDGPIMAAVTSVNIKVNGQGGHGSMPQMVKDAVSAGAAILNNLHVVKSRCIDPKENFSFTITQFQSGFTDNVFPDDALLTGSVRSYNKDALQKIKDKIKHIAETTAAVFDCTAEVTLEDELPPTVNHKTETDHIKRLAAQYLGPDRVSDKYLPLTSSEDFSYYLQQKPGCFFMLGTNKPGTNYNLHTSTYDFNDDCIGVGSYFFTRIVEDRLQVKILDEAQRYYVSQAP